MAITRPTTKTVVSTTAWGIPVTDQLNTNTTDIAALKATAWITLTLLNGFTNDGSMQILQVRKVVDQVTLRGSVTCPASPSGKQVTTIPVGYRPGTTTRLIAGYYDGTAVATRVSRADLDTNGLITFYDLGAAAFLSLNGVTWFTS